MRPHLAKLHIRPGDRAPVSQALIEGHAHQRGGHLVAPARLTSPGQAPLPARVPTSLVLIGGCMQTPVVSSFMGGESGGEQREWAQWGALAGSACSRGEERRGGGRGERGRRQRREGKGGEKDSTVQEGSVNSSLLWSQPRPSLLLAFGQLASRPPSSLLSPPSLLLSGSHLSSHYLSRTTHRNPILGVGRQGPSLDRLRGPDSSFRGHARKRAVMNE